MNRRRCQPGFTLVETVIVLMIIGLLLAMAAPSLRGWSQGGRLRNAADQLLAVTHWARTQAISTATPLRLRIDPTGLSYQVLSQESGQWEPVPGEFGRVFNLPDHCRVELVQGGGSESFAIDFFPTGRTSPAVLRIVADWGEQIELICTSPAEPFRIPVQAGTR